jgi:hypothetical protein
MQKSLLLFIILFSTYLLNAQCLDCFNKNDDWKFAAGVTLYSNKYLYSFELKQPLEFNLRYKLNEHHTLRLSAPIALKVNWEKLDYQEYPFGHDVSVEEYLKWIKGENPESIGQVGSGFYNMRYNYYNLWGISLGYDYSYNFTSFLSTFASADFSYYNLTSYTNYYYVLFNKIEPNNYTLGVVTQDKYLNIHNEFSIKSLLGIRYRFQKLLFEASAGVLYPFCFKQSDTVKSSYIYPNGELLNNIDDYDYLTFNWKFVKFVYQISLFYTL